MSNLRMPEVNHVFIGGRLTRDPELKYIPSGQAVLSFGLASTSHYTDQGGAKKENTTFVDVQVWGKPAEYWSDKIGKGRPVMVEGSLHSSKWETQEGQNRTKVEIKGFRLHALDWDEKPNETGQADEEVGF